MALKKNLEEWLSKHSGERRKALGFTSMGAHQQWCSFENFKANFSKVAEFEKDAFEKGIRQGKSSNFEATIAKRLPPLNRMIDLLQQHVDLICVPVGHRYIELELEPEVELSDLPQLLKAAIGPSESNSEKVEALFEMIQKGGRFQCLQKGTGAAISAISPVHGGVAGYTSDAPNPPPSPDVARHLQFNSNSKEPPQTTPDDLTREAEPDAGTMVANNKRARVPTAIFEPTPEPKKGKSTGKQAAGGNRKKHCSDDPRPYRKSGLYSKDPVKAAMARERLGNPGSPTLRKPKKISAGKVECAVEIRTLN